MSVNYDMNVLAASTAFDVADAEKNFKSKKEFFACLNRIVESHADYLRSYNPTMVIFSDEIQGHFLDELDLMEETVNQLAMSSLMVEIFAMREAVKVGSVQEVSDGIVKFRAKMEIVSADIDRARLSDELEKPKAPVVKPLLLAIDVRTSVLASITGVLQRGYKVISVTNGQRALDMLKWHSPAMILLGTRLHGMSGYELAEQIRADEKFKHTPILFMTDVEAAAGDGHLLVPIDRQLLLKKVEAALSGKPF